MDEDVMFGAVAVQRQRLVDVLAQLDDEEWDLPSLCGGWRVRDVVGHLVSILEIPLGRFVLNAVRARRFDTYADRVAREFGARSPARLLEDYGRFTAKRFAPPIVGPIAPLTDVYVHTRDIERPLGRQSGLDPEGLRTVLDYLCGGKARGFIPAKRTKALHFEATDLDWTKGEGSLVRGTAEAIMMAVTGRRSALDDLAGDGATALRLQLR